MAKYIVQHRRGTTQEWKNSDVVLRDGEIGIEKSTDGYTRLKIGDGVSKYTQLPYMNTVGYALVMKKFSIELFASNWEGDSSPYSQAVDVLDITANSKIDLQVTPQQLAWLQDEEISLTTKNEDGNLIVYAIGAKPTVDFTARSDLGAIQATISETTDK